MLYQALFLVQQQLLLCGLHVCVVPRSVRSRAQLLGWHLGKAWYDAQQLLQFQQQQQPQMPRQEVAGLVAMGVCLLLVQFSWKGARLADVVCWLVAGGLMFVVTCASGIETRLQLFICMDVLRLCIVLDLRTRLLLFECAMMGQLFISAAATFWKNQLILPYIVLGTCSQLGFIYGEWCAVAKPEAQEPHQQQQQQQQLQRQQLQRQQEQLMACKLHFDENPGELQALLKDLQGMTVVPILQQASRTGFVQPQERFLPTERALTLSAFLEASSNRSSTRRRRCLDYADMSDAEDEQELAATATAAAEEEAKEEEAKEGPEVVIHAERGRLSSDKYLRFL
jgi:hypothetical protein